MKLKIRKWSLEGKFQLKISVFRKFFNIFLLILHWTIRRIKSLSVLDYLRHVHSLRSGWFDTIRAFLWTHEYLLFALVPQSNYQLLVWILKKSIFISFLFFVSIAFSLMKNWYSLPIFVFVEFWSWRSTFVHTCKRVQQLWFLMSVSCIVEHSHFRW